MNHEIQVACYRPTSKTTTVYYTMMGMNWSDQYTFAAAAFTSIICNTSWYIALFTFWYTVVYRPTGTIYWFYIMCMQEVITYAIESYMGRVEMYIFHKFNGWLHLQQVMMCIQASRAVSVFWRSKLSKYHHAFQLCNFSRHHVTIVLKASLHQQASIETLVES